jgi:hypothetical protein
VQVLQNAREELLAKVRQQLETASKDGSDSDILRYVILFGPLGAKVLTKSSSRPDD